MGLVVLSLLQCKMLKGKAVGHLPLEKDSIPKAERNLALDTLPSKIKASINIPHEFAVLDHMGAIYLWTNSFELIKLDPNGNELYRFSSNFPGNKVQLDVNNPLNPILYYPEFGELLVLDRTLSPTQKINFYDLNLLDVPRIGWSSDNQIWVYDALSTRLIKMSRRGTSLLQSEQLDRNLGVEPQVLKIHDNGQHVLLLDDQNHIYLFDLFGQFQKELDLSRIDFNTELIDIVKSNLYYIKEHNFCSISYMTLRDRCNDITGIEGKIFGINDQTIYSSTKDSLMFYSAPDFWEE